MSFNKFSNKNIHLEHLEDLVFLNQTDFAVKLIENLITNNKAVNIAIKFDGSPAIIFGKNSKGKFFLGTKSVLNKIPIVFYSEEDIKKSKYNEELTHILCIAFRELKLILKDGIYQGDILYIKESLFEKEIDGETLICFNPNTLIYGVPLFNTNVKSSKIGIAVHTKYRSNNEDLSDISLTNFFINPDDFKNTDKIFFPESEIKNVDFSSSLPKIKDILVQINVLSKSISDSFYSMLESDKMYVFLLKMHSNYQYRHHKQIDLIEFIENKRDNEVNALKTQKGKLLKSQKYNDIIKIFKNSKELTTIFKIKAHLLSIKKILLLELNSINYNIKTFIADDYNNYRISDNEGFVISSGLEAIKLIDRDIFSVANFKSKYE